MKDVGTERFSEDVRHVTLRGYLRHPHHPARDTRARLVVAD